MKKNNSVLLSTPYLIWMVVFTLIPLCVVGYYALTDPATGAFSLTNIRQLGTYLPVLWQSILYSLVSALICLIMGYPVAYYIAHRSEVVQKRRTDQSDDPHPACSGDPADRLYGSIFARPWFM